MDQGGGGGKETTVASAPCPPGCLRSDRRLGPYVVVAASEQRQQISHTRSAHYWLIIIVQPVGRLRVVLLSRGDHTRAMVWERERRARARDDYDVFGRDGPV